MAVKIIDPTPDPEVVKRISCRHCGVRLEYVPNDVMSRTSRDYGGGTDVTEYIVCPACTKEVTIHQW